MQPQEFAAHCDRSPGAPVYLFFGEPLLIEEAWQQLLDRLVPAAARRFNGERMAARECTVAQLLSRLGTLSMFGPKRLLMVEQIDGWPKDQRAALSSYLAKPFPTASLVLTGAHKKGLEKIEAAVAAVGVVVHFAAPAERELPRWLQERARRMGKQLVASAAVGLVEQVGSDLQQLERELEKLCSYVGEAPRIERDDVRQVASAQRTFSVFELLRQVSQRQPQQAMATLRSLMASGQAPLAILALLSRQVRILWQVKDGARRGADGAMLARQIGLPPFAVKNYLQEAAHFTEAELYRMHGLLRELDYALKSTGTPAELLMEGFILELCRREKLSP